VPLTRVPRFLVPPDSIHGDAVSLSDQQSHQIRNVLRLRAGDRVRVFDGMTPVELLVELRSATRADVVERCPQPPEPSHELIACPALLQRDKFETVLQKLTELGIASVLPVITARSLVREPPDARRVARWHTILREATEQCGRGHVPELRPALRFEHAVADAVTVSRTLLAYEAERRGTLQAALADAPDRISLFVGPEGGFEPREAEHAARLGAKLVTLGPRVLRTETASPVFAALVLYELGDLSSW